MQWMNENLIRKIIINIERNVIHLDEKTILKQMRWNKFEMVRGLDKLA